MSQHQKTIHAVVSLNDRIEGIRKQQDEIERARKDAYHSYEEAYSAQVKHMNEHRLIFRGSGVMQAKRVSGIVSDVHLPSNKVAEEHNALNEDVVRFRTLRNELSKQHSSNEDELSELLRERVDALIYLGNRYIEEVGGISV